MNILIIVTRRVTTAIARIIAFRRPPLDEGGAAPFEVASAWLRVQGLLALTSPQLSTVPHPYLSAHQAQCLPMTSDTRHHNMPTPSPRLHTLRPQQASEARHPSVAFHGVSVCYCSKGMVPGAVCPEGFGCVWQRPQPLKTNDDRAVFSWIVFAVNLG